jgi:hypothetical protein
MSLRVGMSFSPKRRLRMRCIIVFDTSYVP